MTRGNSSESNPVTLFAAVPEKDLPTPGSFIQLDLSNPVGMKLVANVYNVRGRGEEALRTPKSLTYVPVATDSKYEEVVHAGIARRVNKRIRLEWFTLCDRKGERVAQQRVAGTLDATVTCKQCRAQLVEDGMLDSVELPDE